MKRTGFVIAAVALQFAVLAFMAGKREAVLLSGRTIWMRTAPIDPRDIFMGDFVRLSYPINRIAPDEIRGELKAHINERSRRVFVALRESDDGLAELEYATGDRPAGPIYIKGRIGDPQWWFGSGMAVKYGIERYYVQQGLGLDMEKRLGERGGVQVPMEVALALGSDGTAIIRDHRWCAIGIGIVTIAPEAPANEPRVTPLPVKVKILLQNASDAPLAIIDLPNLGAFELSSVSVDEKRYVLAQPIERNIALSESHVVVLQPGETRETIIDTADPRWFVIESGSEVKPVAMATLNWGHTFRFVYAPPSRSECAQLSNAHLIWHGRLPSQAFHGGGRVD
ncbi:MAG: GDYXXLXY domain-containing protein [Planctomycetota bacterium]